MVASNYTLVITLYPAMLMIHHRWIERFEQSLMKYTCCICCTLFCAKKSVKAPEPEVSDDEPSNAPQETLSRQLSANDGVGDGNEYRAMEQFLGKKWSKWMDRTKIYNLIFFVILFIVALCVALTQLEPEDNYTSFRKGSWWNRLENMLRSEWFFNFHETTANKQRLLFQIL